MQFVTTRNPADALLEDARTALKQGQYSQAIDATRRVIGYDPGNLQAYWLWGFAAIETYSFSEAETVLDEGARRLPDNHPLRARFLSQRARALIPLGRAGDVRDVVRQALTILDAQPQAADAQTLHMLGACLSQSGGEQEALPVLRRAVALDSRVSVYWDALGEAAQFLGLLDEAERAFENAVAAGPHMGSHLALARLKRWTRDNNHIARLEKLTPEIPLDQARRAYALFKEYDDLGDRKAAWAWLQKGAEAALREPVTPRNPAWSAAEERDTFAAWTTCFPAARFMATTTSARAEPRRLFVIGLPRSGTTLVERILASHSQVQSLGELQAFPAATKIVSGIQGWSLLDADTVRAAAGIEPQAFADFYTRETASLCDGHPMVTDKLPHNSDYAGLIRLAFPDAAIVYVRRQPMDALFGAYKLHFAARWSFALDDLADHYTNHRMLMDHWRQCLGDGLIEVSLETLIAEPETEIRRLLAACGLPFEAACLTPHESAGAVASASSAQVRRPINAEGVGAWRRYSEGLEPLRARLEAAGFVDSNGDAI